MSTFRQLLIILVLGVVGCSPAMRGDVVQVRFWAGDGAKDDPRVVDVTPHYSCAADVAVARIAVLPRAGEKGPLEPERVVEVSNAGDIIRRWSMPVDLIVAAVKGEHILVPLAPMEAAPSARGLLISPQGTATLTEVPPQLPEPIPYECPDSLNREFGTSAYLRCFEFHDLATGDVRRLAFQGPCT